MNLSPFLRPKIRVRENALNQEDGLAGQIKTLAAADIAAGDHIVDANHVGTRLGELLLVLFVGASGSLRFLGAHHPADRIGVFLAAVRAIERKLLGLFLLVVEALFVHRSLVQDG